jgi:predicted ATPase/DNA-binding SARP family transcriptional activator
MVEGAAGMLEVRLLGQFDVRLGGQVAEIPSRPAQSLFAYLILNPGIAHRRERLAGLLWPDSTESNARGYLRHALWRIRRALGDAYLLVDNISISYDLASEYWLDVSLLERPANRGAPVEQLCEEVSVYRGELLPGFYDDWIVPERERLWSVFDHKMDILLASLIDERRWREALEWGERWIALGHAPEPAYRALMVAHNGLGNRAGVAMAYDRCVEALQNEVGVEPSELTQTTYEVLLEGEPPSGEPVDAGVRDQEACQDHTFLHVLPFIGRQRELTEITYRLGDSSCRLLTLVGPGGIGKTRLAIEVARRLDCPESCAHFVSLASITSPALLVSTIAEALGISFYGGQDPRARTLDYLRDKGTLLILDNFEHILEGADLITEMLRSAPGVKILVTSRERLNLHEEWLYEVEGMDFPTDSDADKLEDFSAVELFLQNARRLDPGFSLSDENGPHIVRICQLVEGMPLAIELAVAWIRMLSCREIADELEKSLDFLAVSLRDIPARHRSLRAVFEHSWRLLSETEKQAFRKLSVFQGGFDRNTAEQVAGASLFTLSTLADKSLLRLTPSGRYQIHQTLAQYGRERLDEHSDEKRAVYSRYCEYFAEFAHHRLTKFREGQQKEALEEIEGEIDNLRVAWHWAVEHDRTSDIEKALDGIYAFYESRGWFEEAQENIACAVERLRTISQRESSGDLWLTLARCLVRQGRLRASLGCYEEARSLLEEGLTKIRALDALEEAVFALTALGDVAWELGKYTEARRRHEESATICRKNNNQRGLAISLDKLGFMNMSLGQFEEAKHFLLESVEINREIGDRMGMASPLGNLGWVAFVEGEVGESRKYFEEAIAISREFGNPMVMALDQAGLSVALNAQQEHSKAKAIAQESLSTAREAGYQLAIVTALGGLGDALRAEGDYERARVCLHEGFKIAIELSMQPMYLLLLISWASLMADEGEGERAVEILTLILHNAGEVEAFGRVAEARLATLECELTPDAYALAMQRGKAQNFEQLILEIVGQQTG